MAAASGAWALGIGQSLVDKVHGLSIDAYEDLKLEGIKDRIQSLPKRLRKLATGETRQYDFRKSSERNPLFGPMEEKDRKALLLKSLGNLPSRRESRSAQPAGFEEAEQAACVELDSIRSSRKQVGCGCHTSKSPDKLSLKKLKEELHRRHLSAIGNDKVKLAALLKDALLKERLCTDEACECFQAGVACHANVCGCCAARHGQGCSNPESVQAYKEEAVRSYRSHILEMAGGRGRARSCSF